MLYRNLLRHQWKEFIRNPSWSSISVAYAIFLVLLALYFLLILVLAGAFIGHLLTSQDPAADVVRLVNQHLLSAFSLLFLGRLLFQNTPQLKIGPYLHLPISRPALARFFSFAALFHLHNLLPLAFFIPFWISNLALDYSTLTSLSWLAGIVAILGLSNYLVICVRLGLARRAVWLLGGGASGLIALDYWQQWGYTGALSSVVFDFLLEPGGPVLALALLVATGLLFGWTCRLLKDHLHDEAPSEKGLTTGSQSLLDRLAGLGPVGRLMALEIKLAIRNKRPRQILWFALMFSAAGLINFILLTRGSSDSVVPTTTLTFYHIFWGFFLTSGFVINYGQFMHLQVQNLQKRYGLATVLDLPELDIDSGASFGLVGNNGAGKTTFLRLVLDLNPPKRRPGTAQRAGRGPRRRLEGLHGILPRPCLPHRLPDARGIHPLRRQSVRHEPGSDRGKMGTLPSLFRRSTTRQERVHSQFIRGQQEENRAGCSLDGRAAAAGTRRAFRQSRSDEPKPPQGHAENPRPNHQYYAHYLQP